MNCPTCNDGICTQGCAKGTTPKRTRASRHTPRPAMQDYNQTTMLLMFQYNCASVELERVMHLFGYNDKYEANRAAGDGSLPVPVFKFRDSTKAPYLIHIEDLANWMDSQRATAKAEMDSWTKDGRKAA